MCAHWCTTGLLQQSLYTAILGYQHIWKMGHNGPFCGNNWTEVLVLFHLNMPKWHKKIRKASDF